MPCVAEYQEAQYEALIDSYYAVRAGRITDPETIRALAWRFLEIELDPEINETVPYDAGEAARILMRRAKSYEDQASAGDIYDASAQAAMSGRRRGHGNLMVGG